MRQLQPKISVTHFGKQLIVWGPEYCSAVRWSSNSVVAIPVTNPSPEYLVGAIEENVVSRVKLHEFSVEGFCALEKDFNALQIQSQFFSILKNIKTKN